MTTDLPPGWEMARLGDLSTPRVGKITPAEDDSRPYLSLDNIACEVGRIDGWERAGDYRSQSVELSPGDVAYARLRPYLNKVAMADREALGSAELIVLPPTGALMPEFLKYHLLTSRFVKFAQEQSTGDRPRLKWRQMRHYTLEVPPLTEQQRIVAAIDEHFSRLDGVDVNLGSVARRVNVLEQALINQAMKGERQRLGDHLAEPLRNGFSPPRSSDGNTRVLTLTAVTEREFIEENTKLAVVPQAKRDRLTLRPGDILVQRSNTPELVGTAALYSGPSGWAVFPDLLIRVRPDHTLFPAYLELALRSSKVRHYFRLSAQGIAGSMPKISQSTIEELEIRIPETIAEQQSIVRRISIELQAVKEVQDCVSSACKRADLLRRVVLTAVFAGQLVPQNPGR